MLGILLVCACAEGDEEMALVPDVDYGVGPEVAVGAWIDVVAADACAGSKVNLCTTEAFERFESVSVSDPTVFEELPSPADRPEAVRLRALRAGTVTLEATAVFGGAVRSASATLTAIEPDRATLDLACDQAGEGVLLETGSTIGFQLALQAGGKSLVANGLWPVETDPAGLAQVVEDARAPGFFVIEAAATPGSGVLRTTVPGTSVDLRVFSPDEVDGVFGATEDPPEIGEWVWLEATPSVGGKAVCTYGGSTTMTVLTPEVCYFELDDGSQGLTDDGFARLGGHQAGECRVELTAASETKTVTGSWSGVLK